MVDELLPVEIQRFLVANIDSLVALDTLLMIRGERQRPCPVAEVARRLLVNPMIAQRALADLQAQGLVVDIGSGWLVAELPAQTEAVLTELAKLHAESRWVVARFVARHFFGRLRVMTTAFTRGAT